MRRLLLLEIALIMVALIYIETFILMFELRMSIVRDWFVVIAPLIWLNLSIAYSYTLLRLLFSEGDRKSLIIKESIAKKLFSPNFKALRNALRSRHLKLLWAVLATVYALTYMLLQGSMVVSLSGELPLIRSVVLSTVGYGPVIVWTLSNYLGLVLRPYIMAATFSLSTSSGLVLSLLIFALSSKGLRVTRALPGPMAGFAVACPTCIASPAMGLFLAYAVPSVTLFSLGATSLFSAALALSTSLLLASYLLLWVSLSLLSRIYSSDNMVKR